jgi:ribosomal protein S18 acetylase RimI-like enzyme
MLQATNRFTPAEIEVALELIDIYLNQPHQKDYRLSCAVDDHDQVAGYACFGPTPMTEGTYDLYWIAVDPERQRQGIGDLLLAFVESQARRENGRLLMIETSSQPKYQPTHHFYLKNHYREIARIPDFYAEGDDRVIYCKKLRND